MKLQKLNHWIASAFDEPLPAAKTVRKWFHLGKLNGRMIEGKLYIDVDDPFTSGITPPEMYQPINKI